MYFVPMLLSFKYKVDGSTQTNIVLCRGWACICEPVNRERVQVASF